MSTDTHVFYSYTYRPTTFSLVDVTTKESLWTMDIPVGKKLAVDFEGKQEHHELFQNRVTPATKMKWRLLDHEAEREPIYIPNNKANGTIELPGRPVMIQISYREAPEYPEEYVPVAPISSIEIKADEPVEPEAVEEAATDPDDVVDDVVIEEFAEEDMESLIDEEIDEEMQPVDK